MTPEWEPQEECRIGSLPWFAGLFWLAISFALSGVGRLALKADSLRLSYIFIVLSNKACARAAQCALDGGAKV